MTTIAQRTSPTDALWPPAGALSAAELSRLLELPPPTAEQRDVIEARLGPALVVAGAGSGKTETMAARVVWLVANGIVRREEILGLTFTRKAAAELSERIERRLARIDHLVKNGTLRATTQTDPAFALLRPRVSTYNSFADGIVREHSARIGRDADAALLSPSASWLLARRVVVASRDERLAAREDRFATVVDSVQRLAGACLDHGADPGEVAAFGEEVARRIQSACNPDLAAPGDIERFHTAMSALPMLAGLVRDYASAKQAQAAVDYADQVAGALAVVRRAPEVIAAVRSDYRVVLLDEYQDTSVQQTQLLAALFKDAAVMAVGDPHQSIYGWRGASADNLASFPRVFGRERQCATFALMTSWRNDRAILHAANALIGGQEGAAVQVPPLRARPDAADGAVNHHYAATIEEEAEHVAAFFDRVRAVHRGDTPHSGAILLRTKRHMTVFADALAARGIAHRILGLGGLLATPEVVDVVAALRVIVDPAAGSSLVRLLVGPRFGIGLSDLATLRAYAGALSRAGADASSLPAAVLARLRASVGPDEQPSIIDALDSLRWLRPGATPLGAISAEGEQRLREAARVFHRLRGMAQGSIGDLIRAIERELLLDVELSANETRGPAGLAGAQLRSFLDEVQAFLAADDRGTVSSLLAWLDHAEQTDELMPRTEPPEPGVVQLLTIHGSKGLEWDAVAVPRMVADELPQRPRSTLGWLAYGTLPAAFRGDRDALPVLDLGSDDEPDRKVVSSAIAAFKAAMRAHLEAEERRLAYVAVTRARSELLLTGSRWGGQRDQRAPSPYLLQIAAALQLDEVGTVLDDDNPYDGRRGASVQWPLDPLGARTAAVHDAADLVRAALQRDLGDPPMLDGEIALLLRERDARSRVSEIPAPRRVAASRFKDFVTDHEGALRSITRPVPEKPYRATTLGTRFHAWVEARSGRAGSARSIDDLLWEQDGLEEDSAEPISYSTASIDDDVLVRLQRTFERSEWGALAPLEVETEIDIRLPGAEGIDHVICKLDAVYRRDDRGGRIEIVDWKTGAAPRTAQERDDRMLQLALYRLAYHKRTRIPLDQIDVCLYYVADDLVIRLQEVYSESELVHLWNAARAARAGSSASAPGVAGKSGSAATGSTIGAVIASE